MPAAKQPRDRVPLVKLIHINIVREPFAQGLLIGALYEPQELPKSLHRITSCGIIPYHIAIAALHIVKVLCSKPMRIISLFGNDVLRADDVAIGILALFKHLRRVIFKPEVGAHIDAIGVDLNEA